MLAAGAAVDRYTIEALIGRGGMGEVYRAVDGRLRRKVALKVLRPDTTGGANQDSTGDGVARLFREARAAAALTHPNAISIHDLGETDGLFYIVMELVSGQPLLAYVGDERISVARRLKWLTEIARALATAHRAGVIHRDVKPSNVMVTDEDVAKVLDFGLAKPMPKPNEPESFGFKTQAGRVLGTVRYMAPEQMIGSEADGRSDQYALGMTAYELIAGRYPPGKPFEIPPLLDTVVETFPGDGAKLIARMLKRLPDDRFQSMDDVVAGFEDLAAGRPVRALEIPTGAKPIRLTDTSVIETVQERPAGSTLSSAAKEPPVAEDEFSADTQMAIEEALQPTMTAAELAKLKRKSTAPAAGDTNVASTEPEKPKPKPAHGASTLMSNPDAVAAKTAVLAAVDTKAKTAAMPSAAMPNADAKPASRTELMPSAPARPPSEPPPTPATTPNGPKVISTLASADAGDKVAQVRKAGSKAPVPVTIEAIAIPPPKPPVVEEDSAVSTKAAPVPVKVAAPKKRSNVLIIVLTIAFMAAAAFAGTYFGQRSRAKD